MAVIKLKNANGSPLNTIGLIKEVALHDGRIFCGTTKQDRRELTQNGATLALLGALTFPDDRTLYLTPKPKPRAKSRPDRWSAAVSRALSGLEELVEIQQEYAEWKENLGDSFEGSQTKEKLEAVCELDLEEAKGTVEEAESVDLPMGFARD
jgi:hypothetical protein